MSAALPPQPAVTTPTTTTTTLTAQRPDLALNRQTPAEWLSFPTDPVVSVEHPAIIANIDNGIRSLGGEHHIKHLLAPVGQTLSAGLSLRPHDRLAKKLVSKELPVQNVLLRVTVPKRTGRKRKRGSDDPFTFKGDKGKAPITGSTQGPNPRPLTAEQLIRRLKDNQNAYTVQPVAPIKQTHRYRALPDFQMKAGSQPVMHKIGKNLMNPTLSTIKRFDLDMTPGGPTNQEIVAPPNFTSFEQSMNYGYRQNPGVATFTDDQGRMKTINTQAPKKRTAVSVNSDVEKIPVEPLPELQPLSEQSDALKQAVKNLEELLQTRPVVTRRVAYNLIEWGNEALFKEATQYVGYSFKSGPWRDTLVKYGIDPRTDPKYRIYQTFSFQLMTKDKVLAAAKKMRDGKNQWIRSDRYRKDEQPSHIFDGKGITTNGKTWQICDVKEPLLEKLLATEDLRTDCDLETWGWYQNGTISKVRVIMRDMIGMMLMGKPPESVVYETLSTMPEQMDPTTYAGCYFEREKHGEKVMSLSMDIRNLAKADFAQRARTRLHVEGEIVDDGDKAVLEEDERESDGVDDMDASSDGEVDK